VCLGIFSLTGTGWAQVTNAQPALGSEQKVVKAVEVKGNESISIASILSKIKTRVGQPFLQTVISDDLKRLYNTGFFADVRVDQEDYEGGIKVIFYVKEKPVIKDITFSRTRYYKPPALLKRISSKKGKFLDRKALNDDIRTIKDLYNKKGLTMAEVRTEVNVDKMTNQATVHFVIKEGQRVKIKSVHINGNKTYPNKKILRIIKTRADSLFTSGILKEDVLKEDMERIKAFYEKEGFIDAQASYKLTELTKGRLDVDINIDEGKQYFVEDVTVTGNSVFTDEEVRETMTNIKPGKVFSRDKLSVDLAAIRSQYFDKGYIFANVRQSTSLDPDTGKVNVKLDISEGELAYVNKIKIQGNDRTRDIVIRREMKLYPGDRFDGEKLRRSKQRLDNLGYFEDVNYDIEDTDVSNKKYLVVQVKEAKTGSFSFGGGYSTVDQLIGFVEIQQRNFDFTNWPTFTGGGQQLSLRAETGSTRNNTNLSFTEPWLFDYPISGGFDVYRREHTRERNVGYAFDEKRIGGDIRFGKQFGEYNRGHIAYRREDITIDNFDTNVSADLLAEAGKNTVSTVSFGFSRDLRDNPFSPTKGLYLNGTVDLAGGPMGGDKDFYRLSGTSSYDIPMKFNSVLEFRLRTGIVDAYGNSTKVPIFERFFVGGARTIRGYNERKVGPLDPVTNDPIGGEAMMVGNVEYTFPLIDFIKLAAFYDIGNVWATVQDFGSGGLKSGTGLGLRVKTPIGPISLDYGFPLNKEPGETARSGKFYFSVSRGF